MGFVPMDLFLVTSSDGGTTWSRSRRIEPPVIGPEFEVCHAIIELQDGRWLIPTQTWRGWDGDCPEGMRAIALVSHDRGQSWTDAIEVFDGSLAGVLHFEISVVELAGGRLLAVAWAYDETSAATLPTPYSLAVDGKAFAPPRPCGLDAQTAKLAVLPGDRILCLYRDDKRPGLWANLAHLDDDRWVNDAEIEAYGGLPAGMKEKGSTSDKLGKLKLGFPSMLLLSANTVLAVFWCLEDEVYNIRWIRIEV
jgi:hypothetical protein